MDFYDRIYYSLIGQLNDESRLPWVPDAFAEGSSCEAAYSRMLDGRNRVLQKLGQEYDSDLSQMLNEMDTIQRTLCRELLSLHHF